MAFCVYVVMIINKGNLYLVWEISYFDNVNGLFEIIFNPLNLKWNVLWSKLVKNKLQIKDFLNFFWQFKQLIFVLLYFLQPNRLVGLVCIHQIFSF